MKLFFFSPKYIFNLAAISRTMEVMGFTHVYVYDTNNLLEENHNKAYLRKLNKTSSGAFSYINFEKVEDPINFLRQYKYRTIASVLHHEHVEIQNFVFEENDLVLMGNETNGLAEDIISLAEHRVKIPQCGKTESLNLNIAATMFIYEFSRQLRFTLK